VLSVDLLQEYIKTNHSQTIHEIEHHPTSTDRVEVEAFMDEFERGSIERRRVMIEQLKTHTATAGLTAKEREKLRRVRSPGAREALLAIEDRSGMGHHRSGCRSHVCSLLPHDPGHDDSTRYIAGVG
jgi:hypothetical protein